MVTYSIVWKDWAKNSVLEQSCSREQTAKDLVKDLFGKGFQPIVRMFVNGKRCEKFQGL